MDKDHGRIESWMRAAKREIILPGAFHQLSMDALRPVGDITTKEWAGTLTDNDVSRVKVALTTFFGAAESAGTKKDMLEDQPIPAHVKLSKVSGLMNKLQKDRRGGEVGIDAELAVGLGIKDSAVPDAD